MAGLTSAMDNIARSSVEIKKITQVMEDISFQIDILAINTAVEASRAGTAGNGFAVVADRIRSLAAKSSKAAKDTAELINHSVQDVHTGPEATAQAADIMQVIGECTGLMKEQIHGIAAVSQNADTLRQLSEQAEELDSMIRQFRIGL